MTIEEHELRETRTRRIRRVKRWLRPLPRRSNIHRYPVLGRFSDAARKRIYLWSFRVENAVPALYAGFIVALMPLYGIQIPIAFFLALLLRANLPILVGLQMLSNPLTILPFWYAAYQVGSSVLSVVGVETAPLVRSDVRAIVQNFTNGAWSHNIEPLLATFSIMCLGGIVMGIFFGLLSSFSYRIAARRTAASYAALIKKIHDRKARKSEPPFHSHPNA
jgi:uncharacterized protein (DUF2062 family)